ncbi:MAG: GH32 C-terminal domain-containing protein [Clostridia bacterium]|nr:GH32 C-terminal domain-containing protein [Clostridia bacterium]MDY6184939.1 GH32 C-terminal domain-containing protein [Eubacteriales bacterium]
MNDKLFDAYPLFHITGRPGWINDPNGLVYFRGQYHVFYQYYPAATHWGPMHWGHVVSDDLKQWEQMPIALAPGGKGDRDGCFSGSAIVWQDRIWLLYTGFTENGGGDAIRQVQCLASSADGVRFEKHGVVIDENDLPADYSPSDFRDPKVWRSGDSFFCVVAARRVGGRGRVLLYRSEDLRTWHFVGDLFGVDSRGSMIECPDYRSDLGLLMLCEQFQPQEGHTHLNIHTNRYYLGILDETSGSFRPTSEGICDYGFDFYAPQTFADTPVMIGWMNMWDRNVPSADYGFAGMLTLPRRLEVRDGRLRQTPCLPETRIVRTENGMGTLTDCAVTGVIEVRARDLRHLTLRLRVKGEQSTILSYRAGEWVFDRSHAGVAITGVEQDADSRAGIRRMPGEGDYVSLTVVMDRYSVEVFANGRALTSTVYPDADADGIVFEADAAECTYTRAELV